MSNRKIISLITAILFIIISATAATIEQSNLFTQRGGVSTSTPGYFPVVRVVDGDTVTIERNGKKITVRLIGLDTPEVVDPRKPVQCFGRAASAEAHRLLESTAIRLELDASQGELDKYGRTLAYIFLPDGTFINRYMIEQGFGHEYTYRLPYKYQSEFKALEKSAREAGRGLWAPGVCEN